MQIIKYNIVSSKYRVDVCNDVSWFRKNFGCLRATYEKIWDLITGVIIQMYAEVISTYVIFNWYTIFNEILY